MITQNDTKNAPTIPAIASQLVPSFEDKSLERNFAPSLLLFLALCMLANQAIYMINSPFEQAKCTKLFHPCTAMEMSVACTTEMAARD